MLFQQPQLYTLLRAPLLLLDPNLKTNVLFLVDVGFGYNIEFVSDPKRDPGQASLV